MTAPPGVLKSDLFLTEKLFRLELLSDSSCPTVNAPSLQCEFCGDSCESTTGPQGAATRIQERGRSVRERPNFPVCYQDYGIRSRAVHHLGQSSAQCRRVLLCGSIPNNDPEVQKAMDMAEAGFRSEARKAGRSYLVAPATAPDAPLCGTMPQSGIRRDDFGHLISLNVRVVGRSHLERCVFSLISVDSWVFMVRVISLC